MNEEKIIDVRKLIGLRLKEARELMGLSQRKLGLLTGLSDKTISAYEKARVLPPLEVLIRISKQLNKPVSYFLGEDNAIERLTSKIARLQGSLNALENVLNELKNELSTCEDQIIRVSSKDNN